jgi:hypothetical protein
VTSFGPYTASIWDNALGAQDTDIEDKQWLYVTPEITGLDTVEVAVDLAPDIEIGHGRVFRVLIQLRNVGQAYPSGYYVVLLMTSGTTGTNQMFVDFGRNGEALPVQGSTKAVTRPGPGTFKFKGEVSGGLLKAYVNGVLVHSVQDPNPLPPGNPGVGLIVNIFPSDSSDVRITSFEVSPCPPSGDPRLDPVEVRKVLLQALFNSQPNTAPELRQRRERGGLIYQNSDGTLGAAEGIDPQATVCEYKHGRAPVTLPIGATPLAGFHTHPHKTGERVYDDCKNQVPPGLYGHAHPTSNGGGSDLDWDDATASGYPEFVMTNEGIISRLDPNTAKGVARQNNKNRWNYNTSKQASCFTKVP